MRRFGWAVLALAAACGTSDHASPGAAPAPTTTTRDAAAPAPAATTATLALIGCAPQPVAPGSSAKFGFAHPRVHIIGHGTARPGPEPTMHLGGIVVTGTMDKAIVRRYLKRNVMKLEYCYERQLIANPSLGGGTVAAQFAIRDDGTVTGAAAQGLDATVSSCVADTIAGIEFPKPPGGTVVQVAVPFDYDPGKPPDAGAPAADLDADVEPFEPYGTPWLPLRIGTASESAAVAASLAKAATAAITAKLADLGACITPATPPGSLRAVVLVDTDGSVVAQVGGLGETHTADCLVSALASVKVPGPDGHEAAVLACDLVHGAAAPWRLAQENAIGWVEVTPDRISYAGHFGSTYPDQTSYAIAADPATPGAQLARALVKTAAGDATLVGVTDGRPGAAYVAETAGSGDPGGAARVTVARDRVAACGGVPASADLSDAALDRFAKDLRAACGATCAGAVTLAFSDDVTAGDLARVAAHLRAAGFDAASLTRAACP